MTYPNIAGKQFAVTGGSGFVGRRVVEMLVERGASRVVSFDIREPITKAFPEMNFLTAEQEKRIEYIIADISDAVAVSKAFKGVDAVFHIAAAVGPFIAKPVFHKVNVVGTENVVNACKLNGIKKLVAASTPSIFFKGQHISGAKPSELEIAKPGQFLATYAETKAVAEKIVREANSPPDLMTVNIAPHTVYGPRDSLFVPNIIETAPSLRIMGTGENLISFTHVDNYSDALVSALDQLFPGSPILGNYYIVTDEEVQNFWKVMDQLVVYQGATSLYKKFRVPSFIMYTIAYVGQMITWFTGSKFRITPFNVTMLTIDRYFNIDEAVRDLKYKPLKKFDAGWNETLLWFSKNRDFARMCAQSSIQGKTIDVKKSQ